MSVEISVVIAIIGCFVGLAGWLSGREKRISSDAKWKGSVDSKLETIIGISRDVEKIEEKVEDHGEKIAIVENSVKSAHRRIDEALMKK